MKAIFCVCDYSCSKKAKVMLDSFNKYNEGYDSYVFTYGNFSVEKYNCINFEKFSSDLNIPVFDKCEIFRFFAARNLIEEYDTVIYCDCDCMFFGRVPEYTKKLVFSEHFIDWSKCKNINHFFDECCFINIGFMIFNKTDKSIMDYICSICMSKERFIFEDKKRLMHIRLQPFISHIPYMYKDCEFIKDYGINVAYWNLKSENLSSERDIIKIDGKYYVNNDKYPLIMFHFSGMTDCLFTRFNGKMDYSFYGEYIKEIVDNYRRLLCNT